MEEARVVAQRELDEQRAAVETERAQFQTDRARWEQQVADANQARVEAEAARTQATERLEDVQRLVTQFEHQVAEAAERQKALEVQLQAAERDRRELQEQLAARDAAAAQEREAAAQHLRTVEDRSHAEVDRARQEAKVLRTDLERAERAHQQSLRDIQQRESDLRVRLGHEERSAGEHAARVRVLEEQLARLDGLGDALRSAQEAMRAALDREAQLREALDEGRRRNAERPPADAPAAPRKKASTRGKRLSSS